MVTVDYFCISSFEGWMRKEGKVFVNFGDAVVELIGPLEPTGNWGLVLMDWRLLVTLVKDQLHFVKLLVESIQQELVLWIEF